MADSDKIASPHASSDDRKSHEKSPSGVGADLLMDISPTSGDGGKREASPAKTTDGAKKFHPNVDDGKRAESKEKSPIAPAEPAEKKKTPEPADNKKIPADDKKSPANPASPAVAPAGPAVTPASPTVAPAGPTVTPATPGVTPARPADDKKKTPASTPHTPADENKAPAGHAGPAVDENKTPIKQAEFGLRPNQNANFDDDHFEMKMYAHETDKDKEVDGKVVEKQKTPPSQPAARQIPVVNDDDEEEEEEEEELPKVVPKPAPIVEASKPKLDRDERSTATAGACGCPVDYVRSPMVLLAVAGVLLAGAAYLFFKRN